VPPTEHIAAVIPCHNEAAAIAEVVRAVRRHIATVIVVDDGSCDDTAALAERAGATVLQLAPRRGKGAALQAGFARAHELGFSHTLMLDGDGQHTAGDIPAFLQRAEQGGAELIVGNRMAQAARMPFMRRQVNRAMSWVLSRLAGKSFPDSQCGFRLMNLSAWRAVTLRSRNFEIESEMLLAFARAGRAISFVPVAVIYRDERSKISVWRDTWRWLRWLNRIRRAV
jgi:glycosyltransferase involved in cell wall biosynthesis